AEDPEVAVLSALAGAILGRLHRLRHARQAGLTTVEVAVITAVLLGLATALLAVVAAAVRRRQAQIR
ncbi:MAG TPA: hypothetical protein VEL73_08120, partial [Mycobacteriales bacterium]|nr:hypothetical protein [Mycobacteriales bacterium]